MSIALAADQKGFDAALVARARELPYVRPSELAHEREHSLEVQLPFLQRVLGRFSLLPVAVGRSTGAEVEELLEPGGLDAAAVHTPSVYVQRLVRCDGYEKRIERKTVRA